jgi:hypothetical protein
MFRELENLQIRSLKTNSLANSILLPVHSASIITYLLQLAQEIFDGVCADTRFHPACEFRTIVHGAASLVLYPPSPNIEEGQEIDELALQSLQDLMHETGLEWPGNILDMTNDFNSGWEPDANGIFNL